MSVLRDSSREQSAVQGGPRHGAESVVGGWMLGAWPCDPSDELHGRTRPTRPSGPVSSTRWRPAGRRTVLLPWSSRPACRSTLSSAQGLARITSRVRAVPRAPPLPIPGVTRSAPAAGLAGEGGPEEVVTGWLRRRQRYPGAVRRGRRARGRAVRVCTARAAGAAVARSRESARRPGPDRSASTRAAALATTASADRCPPPCAPGRRGAPRSVRAGLAPAVSRSVCCADPAPVRRWRGSMTRSPPGAEVDREMADWSGVPGAALPPPRPPPGTAGGGTRPRRCPRASSRVPQHALWPAPARAPCAVWKRAARVPLQRPHHHARRAPRARRGSAARAGR